MLSCLLLAFRFSKVITSTARVSKPFQEKFHITLLLFSFSTPRCAGLEEAEKNARMCMNMLSLNGPQILVYSFLWYGVARSGSAICCSLMSVLRSLKYLSRNHKPPIVLSSIQSLACDLGHLRSQAFDLSLALATSDGSKLTGTC